ncbi:MAG: phosphatase PAP2 family protein [bacterium]
MFNPKRIIILIITLISIFLYYPVNRFISGGVELKFFFDDFIPIVPVFIIPYLIGTILFIIFPIFVFIKIRDKRFYSYSITIIIASIISVLIYFIYPTYVSRVDVTGVDIFSNLLKWLYSNDNMYNAIPSGHTFYTFIMYLYLQKWFPKYKYIFAVIAFLIIISTQFTGQHNIIDMIVGLLFGYGCYSAQRLLPNSVQNAAKLEEKK